VLAVGFRTGYCRCSIECLPYTESMRFLFHTKLLDHTWKWRKCSILRNGAHTQNKTIILPFRIIYGTSGLKLLYLKGEEEE
jgi:hypothetical protein